MSNELHKQFKFSESKKAKDRKFETKKEQIKSVVQEFSHEELKQVSYIIKTNTLHNTPKNAEELWTACKVLFGFEWPTTACSEENNAPFEWIYDTFFSKYTMGLTLSCRGGGKTLGQAQTTFLSNHFNPNYEVITAASILNQSNVSKKYLTGFSEDEVLKQSFLRAPTATSAKWKNNSSWSISTGSQKGVSGQHPQRLNLDEIEFWDYAALEQTYGVPQDKFGYRKMWSAFSTRQRSFGCLPAYTRIITEDGPMKISKIVNTKYSGKVKCVDSNGKWQWKKVINWFRNGSSDTWYKVYLKYTGLGKGCELIATGNHAVYYDLNKKKPLEEFTENDSVVLPSLIPTDQQKQILYGGLLGDSCIQRGIYRMSHAESQLYYLKWKMEHLSSLNCSKLTKTDGSKRSHENSQNEYIGRVAVSPYLHRLNAEFYPDGKRRIPDYVWDELDNLGLAVWIMDDGCYRKRRKSTESWHIYCLNFNKHERLKAKEFFKKLDIDITFYTSRKEKPEQQYIYIGGKGAKKLREILSPYIDVSEHLGEHRKGWKKWVANLPVEKASEGCELVPIKKIEIVKTQLQGKYDIEVEDNHNYLNGSNVLVSNSMSRMVDLAQQPNSPIKLYQWNVFEILQRCPTCLCIKGGKVISNPENTCFLWENCKGELARKSSGWFKREDAEDLKRSMTEEAWQTQYLCSKPSSHGLVLYNFEHSYARATAINNGNLLPLEYEPSLPLYVSHDPAESKTSFLVFFQIWDGRVVIIDELVDDECYTVDKVKIALEERLLTKGYAEPQFVIVDPHRTDAGEQWQTGAYLGSGRDKKYQVSYPEMKENNMAKIEPGLELFRTLICNGSGERRFFVNPDTCPRLMQCIKEHHYKIGADNKLLDGATPSNEFKDGIDACRYALIWAVQRGLVGGSGATLFTVF